MENNNKLIAEFMGIKPKKESFNLYTYSDMPFYSIRKDSEEKVMQGICEYVKYKSSWDWLMPVIKKIRGIINEELTFEEFDSKRGYEQRLNPYNYDIDSIYNGVIEFIKWYNQK